MTPTPEMIEAAARALCTLEGHEPDYPASHFDSDDRELIWDGWKAYAEAALTAALSAAWMGIESVVEECKQCAEAAEAESLYSEARCWRQVASKLSALQPIPSPPESKI